MRHSVLAGAALSAVLSACGLNTAARDSPDASSPADAPFVVVDGEVMVSCGGDGAGWPPSVMPKGVAGVLSEEEARRIFEGILSDPMTGQEAALSLFPDGVDVSWRVLRADEDSLTIGLGRWTEEGPRGVSARVLKLEREGDAWRAGGWAGCQLSPVLREGHGWVEVSGYKGDPLSAQLTARVTERECASGRDPEPFLREPFVVETSEKVRIYWTSQPPKAGDCRANPVVEKVVELKQPLGTRVVFDGFSYPPREVRATRASHRHQKWVASIPPERMSLPVSKPSCG